MKFFLDTYALVELVKGQPGVAPYAREGVTSLYHLYEMHVVLARSLGDESADTALARLRDHAVDVSEEDVRFASRTKRQLPPRGLSYADALGYAMARNRALGFVTGDKAFRSMVGVEWIGPPPAR